MVDTGSLGRIGSADPVLVNEAATASSPSGLRPVALPLFTESAADNAIIRRIVDRAMKISGARRLKLDRLSIHMDLSATHANGNPLRLADLLAADDFNFLHDVLGIARHLDRNTGKLGDCFSPRFSQRTARAA